MSSPPVPAQDFPSVKKDKSMDYDRRHTHLASHIYKFSQTSFGKRLLDIHVCLSAYFTLTFPFIHRVLQAESFRRFQRRKLHLPAQLGIRHQASYFSANSLISLLGVMNPSIPF